MLVTTGGVKPSAESPVQISSDYRRWCHALWRQLRLLSTLSRLPAAPAGSGSPPSPSAHLVSRRLLSSESVEIIMGKITFWHLSLFLWASFINALLYEAAGLREGLVGFYLAPSCAAEGLSSRYQQLVVTSCSGFSFLVTHLVVCESSTVK